MTQPDLQANAAATTGASQAAIAHHYDVGNAFYELWLDETMTYSAALWHGDESLREAQRNKLDWHLDRVDVESCRRLLDIGCGWGSLLRRAKERAPGLTATGLTLSSAQLGHIAQSPMPHVNVRLEGWQTHAPDLGYDAIVSIGAFEHFARLDQSAVEKRAGYRAFFQSCHRALVPGGRMSIQSITYERSDRSQFGRFFSEEIFPESDLPHLPELLNAAEGYFELVELRNDRAHYARTLRAWLSNLRNKRAEVEDIVHRDGFQRYERYLATMVVAFHIGALNLARVAFRRVDSDAASVMQ
ncbi:class I SAM-dependent methyltransferase [Pendulispora albinea]|uniref:Cyclopropane-fatty-acyl-phospholipid synthase family protein n=1 Tax=Pendulispora albinea TaxID=2741071 RepID=A0ABZ2LLM7_9BACT